MKIDELVAGTRLGDYRIERLLGRGAMGPVYVATRLSLDRPVALKVLAAELAREPGVVARFVQEGRAAARLRHDHVAAIFDVGTADDVTYLAMELLEGEPLSQRFARGPLPPDVLASLMLPVLAAVATAHEMGLVHRDLKPDNVFMRRDAQGLVKPVVLDFGISKVIEDALPHPIETRPLIGTPYYVSPEQARGVKIVTSAADQYALGVLMYEGVTGRRPFDGATRPELVRNIIAGTFARPEVVNPAVPKTLANVIVRAMSLDTMSRFTSAWAMGAMLMPVATRQAQDTWRGIFARKTGGFAAADAAAERAAGAHAVATAEAASQDAQGRSRSRVVPIAVGLVAAALIAWLFSVTRVKPGVALPTTSAATSPPSSRTP